LAALHLRGLLATVATTNIALTLVWGAVQSIFLAVQVQAIDPAGAAGNLAIVVGIGSIGAMAGAPIAGVLSDRTRTRWGGRGPWMLAGAGGTVVLAVLLAFAHSIPLLTVYWFLMQVSTNFVLTPLSAHIPDRVPLPRRGLFSSTLGLCQLAGTVAGQAVGAAFASAIGIGYAVVAVVFLLATIVFVLVNRRSNVHEPKPAAMNVRTFLRTFWVNPVKHPNFAWTFLGRFLLFVGYFPLQAYTFYILQDYIGLGKNAVESVAQVGLAALLGTVVGTPLAGLLADKIRRVKPLVAAASGLLIVAFAVPMISPTLPGMLVYSFLGGAGLGSFLSVDYVLITQVLPSADDVGKDLGVINITTTLPQTIGVAVASVIVTLFSPYAALFPVAMGFVLAGALMLFFIRGVR